MSGDNEKSDDDSDYKYNSIKELIDGVDSFVLSFKEKPKHYAGFKINVFLGRGVETFKLNNNKDDKKYSSLEELLKAVGSHITSYENDPEYFVGFKVQVFLGRGAFTFKLNTDEESETASKISDLKKQLAEAEQELEVIKNKKSKKTKD